jgi:sulfatase modifying factor 1
VLPRRALPPHRRHSQSGTDAQRFGNSFLYAAQLSAADEASVEGALHGAPWWLSVRGASWRAPYGGAVAAPPNHPAVHVSHDDAAAFCAAAGKRLPSEREWEYAARGGLPSRRFPWGDDGAVAERAHTFAGDFPWRPARVGPAPVASYSPNAFGLYDMAGNIWEWTADELDHSRRTQRGGSFMCHRRGCYRYRVSARLAQTRDSTASNVGFRCIADAGSTAFAACVPPPTAAAVSKQ